MSRPRAALAMNLTETPFVFEHQGTPMLGILAEPAGALISTTALVVVVGGPQYRAGSHRLFTQLARSAAAQGFATLRFDVRGMGDSAGDPRPFDGLSDDIGAALDALQAKLPQIDRVVLWGLCDGASAALLYLDERTDQRVAGLVLLNPWVRSALSLARSQVRHYYRRRLLNPAFWRKLVRGGVGLAALREWLDKRRLANSGEVAAPPAAYQQRMARAWRAFRQPMLLVLADEDETACEFLTHAGADPAWDGVLSQAGLTRCTLSCADHTFSAAGHGQRVIDETIAWLRQHHAPAAQAAANRPLSPSSPRLT